FDIETGEWHLARVLETYEIDYDGDLVTLQLPEETITATGGHPFWVLEGDGLEDRPAVDELIEEMAASDTAIATSTETGRWVSARDLQPGDIVLDRAGERHEILSTEVEEDARLKTYN